MNKRQYKTLLSYLQGFDDACMGEMNCSENCDTCPFRIGAYPECRRILKEAIMNTEKILENWEDCRKAD